MVSQSCHAELILNRGPLLSLSLSLRSSVVSRQPFLYRAQNFQPSIVCLSSIEGRISSRQSLAFPLWRAQNLQLSIVSPSSIERRIYSCHSFFPLQSAECLAVTHKPFLYRAQNFQSSIVSLFSLERRISSCQSLASPLQSAECLALNCLPFLYRAQNFQSSIISLSSIERRMSSRQLLAIVTVVCTIVHYSSYRI